MGRFNNNLYVQIKSQIISCLFCFRGYTLVTQLVYTFYLITFIEMFFGTNDLNHLPNDECMIHYNCSNCDDGQVIIENPGDFKEGDTLYLFNICTKCGYQEYFIDSKNLMGYELLK